MNDKNLGVLERWWAIQWARIKGEIYTMFHWGTRVEIQSAWVEDRRAPQFTSEYLVTEDSAYREVVRFVGVVRGYRIDDTFQVIRCYYGNPQV